MQNLVAKHQFYSPVKNRSDTGTLVITIFQIKSRVKAEGRKCGIQKVCNGKRQLKFLCYSELKASDSLEPHLKRGVETTKIMVKSPSSRQGVLQGALHHVLGECKTNDLATQGHLAPNPSLF